ncbi:hypothetical protein GTW46_14185 [Streptomyces sp. SID6013]|nr:hypothetical protein [Streptomyces sp. SID6013]
MVVDPDDFGRSGQSLGAVGTTLVVGTANDAGGQDVHLVDVVDGAPAGRPVTGLPRDAVNPHLVAGTPDRAVLTYQTADTWQWALVDLADGAVLRRHNAASDPASVTLSETHVAWAETDAQGESHVVVTPRGTGFDRRYAIGRVSGDVRVGLVGDWVTYGVSSELTAQDPDPLYALTARHLTSSATREVLDHTRQTATAPDGTLYVSGGTVANGEGLYRVAPGADGAPVATRVASSGEPTRVTLLGDDIPDVVATAHLARSARLLSDAARVLGRHEEADRYAALSAEVREAFNRAYVTSTGRILSDAPTVYALALVWDLLIDEEQRRRAGERLADLVRIAGFRISTGFVGTPLVTDALTATGHVDVAYRLLLQTGCPSWLYPVTMGATTIWERWDSMLPDGSINPGEMTSFNHYALGAVADWLHRQVAGLAPAAPGYRRLLVQPRPCRDLTSASARHLTPYGEAFVAWERIDGRFSLEVRVPVGAIGEVHLPGSAEPVEVRQGRHQWVVPDPLGLPGEPTTLRTVRDVLDDPETWAAVVGAAVATGLAPRGEAQVAAALAGYLDAPATHLAGALIPQDLHPGAEAFQRAVRGILDPVSV